MKRRKTLIVLATAVLLAAGLGACLNSNLENGFDLNSPLILIPDLLQSSSCTFGAGSFGSCQFGQ